jgi:uncharacterized membrane protein YfcA
MMPGALAEVFASPGFVWLVAAVFIAGLVRGFSGFGTGMVYLPVASQFLTPFEALTTLIVMDMVGPWPNVPRAIREGHPRDVLRLATGVLLFLPPGVWVLGKIAPEIFRYGVSFMSLVLLVLLVAGFRYRGVLRSWMIYATGGLGGFLAGSVGLPGPPVIMLYMASPHPARVIRANTMIYLMLCDVMMLGVLWLSGYLVNTAVIAGLVLSLPYLAGNVAGGRLFRPDRERVYRMVAYAVIAVSALQGLPLFDKG